MTAQGLEEGNAPDGIWTDSAATTFAGGSGTKDDPYQIATPEQLAKLAADVNSGEAMHPENIVIQAGTTKEVWANICEDYDGGHEAGETTMVDPTCTEDGKKFQSCTKCGAELF